MKRTTKNIIMIIILIVMIGSVVFTSYYAQSKMSTTTESSTLNNNTDTNNSTQGIPDKPDGEMENSNGEAEMPEEGIGSGTTPPDQPSGETTDGEEPPEKPDGEESGENAPEMPNNNNTDTGSNTQMPDNQPDGSMSSDEVQTETTSSKLSIIYYVIFSIESLIIACDIIYLIMSGFNKKTLKESFNSKDKIIIFILSIIITTSLLTIGESYITKNINFTTTQNNNEIEEANNSTSDTASAANTIDGSTETLNESYTTNSIDESVILVKNGGNLTLTDATVTKTGGDSSNTENSEFYGINAGILVTSSSTATITNTTISTNATGSNAVFATGTDAKIYISDSTITTTGSSSSRGLDATYGGYIEADNVTITTAGGSCATLATDKGEGTVIASNSTLETNGTGSPIIYSTGKIEIDNTTGTANNSQMVVIEGKNSATVTNSELSATGTGNRGDVDIAGIMIYQSMSGDADTGTGTFTATDSTLKILSSSDYYKTAPMFFITNTDAVINLTNTKLSYGSNILISAMGTDEWGNSGSNGGNVTFNAENQNLTGDIEIDNISTLTLNLTDSTYKGTINSENTAKSITIKLDSDSTLTLTGNSYITSLDDEDTSYSNINFNGYKLYVNGTAIN